MTLKLTPETEALFALIHPSEGKDATAHTDGLYATVTPIHAALEAVEDAMTGILRALRKADAAETEPNGHVYFERVKQTCHAALREIRAAAQHIEGATDACFQLDEYARVIRQNLDTHDERMALQELSVAGVVKISVAEFTRLKKIEEQVELSKGASAAVPSPA